MDWDDLKYFLAVARFGSLSEAAVFLKSSPATIGRRVADLETRLHTRLFDHRPSGYQLTEAGEAIRAKVEDVEEAVLGVERAAVGRDLEVNGIVRVAATELIASVIVVPALSAFLVGHPGLTIELVTGVEFANLTRRDADIALRGVRAGEGDLIQRRIGNVAFGLYVSRQYAADRNLRPGLSDLSVLAVINWTEEWAHLRGGPWLKANAPASPLALASNSTTVHLAACKAGMGAAILPCFAADFDSDLICLLPTEAVFSVELFLVVHRDLVRTACIRAVLDFLAGLGPRFNRPGAQSAEATPRN
jgi:DNA-binding transcriptional LysR family regulator